MGAQVPLGDPKNAQGPQQRTGGPNSSERKCWGRTKHNAKPGAQKGRIFPPPKCPGSQTGGIPNGNQNWEGNPPSGLPLAPGTGKEFGPKAWPPPRGNLALPEIAGPQNPGNPGGFPDPGQKVTLFFAPGGLNPREREFTPKPPNSGSGKKPPGPYRNSPLAFLTEPPQTGISRPTLGPLNNPYPKGEGTVTKTAQPLALGKKSKPPPGGKKNLPQGFNPLGPGQRILFLRATSDLGNPTSRPPKINACGSPGRYDLFRSADPSPRRPSGPMIRWPCRPASTTWTGPPNSHRGCVLRWEIGPHGWKPP